MSNSGFFITFEGIEGSGKTTQIRHVAEHLSENGWAVEVTREPGGTPIGRKIRRILLDPDNKKIGPVTELMLYMADRAQHLHEVIRPALAEGRVVLCDRYADATIVYQGCVRKVGFDLSIQLHEMVFANLKPVLTILLDLPPETGLQRAWRQIDKGGRDLSETRFENEALSFHRDVRAGYLALARREPNRFAVIDARQQEHQVSDDIIDVIDKALSK